MRQSYKFLVFTLFCCLSLVALCGDAYAADVLETVRDKAAHFIKNLRPLIFILAGFGLIGFAFGAIFGKISWKWFANIAIGLFLVANVGLFVDYFASKSGSRGQYTEKLGYGKYLDASGGYTATPGSSSAPSSQKDPGTSGDGKTENSSSDDVSGSCVPGTGTGCTSGSNIDGFMLDEVVITAPDLSGNKQSNLGDLASKEGFNLPTIGSGSSSSSSTQSNSKVPSGEQMNNLAEKAKEQYDSTGKIDMNQLLRDEVAAGNMTAEQAAQAGAIFTEVANSKGGNVGAAIDDVLKGSQEQMEAEKASANTTSANTASANTASANTDMASSAGNIGNLFNQIIEEETPDEEPLPGTGFEQQEAACKAKGGYWINFTCKEIPEEETPDEEPLPGTGFEQQEAACKAKGGYWINFTCKEIPEEETPDEEPLPGTGFEQQEAACKAKGGYWINFTCKEIPEEETPDEEPLPGTGFEQQEAACKAKGGYWINFTCKEIPEEETPDEEPLPGTGYDVDGGMLDEVVVTGKDYSAEKRNCMLTGGTWNSSKLACDYEELNSPIDISNSSNANSSNVPSHEQMNALAQRAKEEYDSSGKIDMNRLLREEIAAGRMTAEQAAWAGGIFTEVANSNGGDVGAAIDEVLKGSKQEMEVEKSSSTNMNTVSNNASIASDNTPQSQNNTPQNVEEESGGVSYYSCQKLGGTWDDSSGTCKGVSVSVSRDDEDEENVPAVVEDEESDEDTGISFYGCSKMGGAWIDDKCVLPGQ